MKKLVDIYATEVAAGRLRDDTAQHRVIDVLAEVQQKLETQSVRRGFSLFRRAAEPIKGLYIWGGVGRGKSMLMDMFFDNVDVVRKRRVHFHAFMQEIHEALHNARKSGVDDAILPVAKAISDELRLLCFDEMQINDITDAMIVGRLFEQLFAAGVVIITTSNRVPADLYKDGLNRALFLPFIDLLQERLSVIDLNSDNDYRQHRLTGTPRYFEPNDATAKLAMDAVWDDLVDGKSEPLVLTVKSRKVTLPFFHNGVGRASFADLCERPLGAGDYLAIADALRVLLLDDIPQLGGANNNEAKRFVTLIDALYEAKVKLIASAAASPEELYLSGAGIFEFERTASRLREMQGVEWGA
ncbi:AFG1-like ATPase [Rhodobacterales bacterium HTCC2150]|nr:AFG1-like ATPase [Rhodobacterales bacterium HTCC2150] [Rhodobacteraceae bacterium HTCC2150]